MNVFENANRERRERRRLFARLHDRDARTRVREDDRGHARASHRDVHADTARRGFAPQLVADGARRTEEPLQSTDVDRDEIAAMTLVTFITG